MAPPEPVQRRLGAALNLLVPGLAQFIRGRTEAGATYLGLALLAWLVAILVVRHVEVLPGWAVFVALAAHGLAAWAALVDDGEDHRSGRRLP